VSYLWKSEAHRWGEIALRERNKTAGEILIEDSARVSKADSHYDVFLSHSFKDALAILGIKRMMESFGLSVYVDWLEDPNLDRSNVNVTTARVLRERMDQSFSLVYAHSGNSGESSWMPWELGYFDGRRPKFVWILPIVELYNSEFARQEYLCLYPIIEVIDIPSHLGSGRTLGFPNVNWRSAQEPGRDIPLPEAIRGRGVFAQEFRG
jgi:hypothetical protein